MMMRQRVTIVALVIGSALNAGGNLWAEEQESEQYLKDPAAGVPEEYSKHYLVATGTVSPDEKFTVIYPTLEFSESKQAKNFLVALKPFKVLATLPTDEPYFQDQSNGGVGAEWSGDDGLALITFDSKWGPRDVFLVELEGDKVQRITNILEKVRELVRPKFRAAKPKPKPYNDAYEFIFEEEEGGACNFEDEHRGVKVYTKLTNDPKGTSKRKWEVLVNADWDIAQAKFISQKITPPVRDD